MAKQERNSGLDGQVSALMDGELEEAEAACYLSRIKQSPQMRETWDTYHLIGDVLRGENFHSYQARCMERIAVEPTVLAPQPVRSRPQSLLRYALSAAAAVAGVALVVWTAAPGLDTFATAQLKEGAAPLRQDSPPGRREQVENYLFAHQASSTMQAPQIQLVTQESEGTAP